MTIRRAEILRPDSSGDRIRQLAFELPRVAGYLGHAEAMLEGMLSHGASLFPDLFWASIGRGGRTEALVPLIPVVEAWGPFRVRALYSPNRFDVLYADTQLHEGTSADCVIRALFATPIFGGHPADILRLRALRSESSFRSALLASGVRPARSGDGANYIALEQLGVMAEQRRSKNLRNQIKRAERRLSEAGELRFLVHGQEIDEALQRFLDLECAGYKSELNALRNEQADLQVLSSALAFSARSDRVVVAELYVGAELAASQISLHVDRTLYLLKVAFNERFRDGSPGTLLLARFLDHCESNVGVERVDFCVNQIWHERWHPSLDDTLDFAIPNTGTLMGLALSAKRALKR